MTYLSGDRQSLTDEEIKTIKRFQRALKDMGVQGKMMSELAGDSGVSDVKVLSEMLDQFLSDVIGTKVSKIHKAGISLNALVELARDCDFPDDFLPKSETVDLCTRLFWQDLRGRD